MERSSKDFIAEAANMECSGRRGERKEDDCNLCVVRNTGQCLMVKK